LLAIVSSSAAARLAEIERLLLKRSPVFESVVVAPSRDAADDFARRVAVRRGGLVGVQRASVAEFLVKLSSAGLAARGLTPATGLGLEALAMRVIAEAQAAGELEYLERIAGQPGLPRAVLRTLREARLADVSPAQLEGAPRTGPDLARLLRRFEHALVSAGVADLPLLLSLSRHSLEGTPRPSLVAGRLVVLLDVGVTSLLEREFLRALAHASGQVVVTVPDGDARTLVELGRVAAAHRDAAPVAEVPSALVQVQRGLSAASQSSGDLPSASAESVVQVFSAPGEGREAVEIVRGLLKEAARGLPFDSMAVIVRPAGAYAAVLEGAFRRAGVPAWFARGTQRPHRAGRAFLALISCCVEGLSAKRFAEYLSLGQVPGGTRDGSTPRWLPPDDDVVIPTAMGASARDSDAERAQPAEAAEATASRLTAPWKWERLLNDAAVIGGADRWRRRLDGLSRELELGVEEASREEPDSARVKALHRDLEALSGLRGFALPIIERLASWPESATWPEWIERLEELAPFVLANPDRVLAVIAGARAMATLGPVTLAEVRDVLHDRLSDLQVPPPASRFGRVFVGTPDAARGRAFDVVFVPGLAERVFPQRAREDPLLLDAGRRAVQGDDSDGALTCTGDRFIEERLRLRLAVGAATRRLFVSFPSLEAVTARDRLPSLYLLDLYHSLTGAIPDHEEIARIASAASGARLAWPAPPEPAGAIDQVEHDLARLRQLLLERDPAARKGRARYLLDVNAALARSLRSRYARGRPAWSPHDGVVLDDAERAHLGPFRLSARPYSASALQRFSACPYRFYLSSMLRLEPMVTPAPAQTLDPLTRGRLMHEAIAACTRTLLQRGAWPRSAGALPAAVEVLDATLDEVAGRYHDELAPAVERLWRDEVGTIRADLRGWLVRVAESSEPWLPAFVELGFGFAPTAGLDPASRRDSVTLEGGWQLHGVVDLVERRPDAAGLRVTDYKTGRKPVERGTVVGQGNSLQPVLYGLAMEAALHEPVMESRLWFCTAVGRYSTREVPLTPDSASARRAGREVLEIIDRAVEQGFLPAAPRDGACAYCDFRQVCGPHEERRVRRKDRSRLGDLDHLRSMR
jgi:RecB family exonuclease